MIELDFITLEDGIEYAIIDEIVIDGSKFLYLVDDNSNKFELRKLDKDDYLVKTTQEEYNKALVEFAKIHKNDLAS